MPCLLSNGYSQDFRSFLRLVFRQWQLSENQPRRGRRSWGQGRHRMTMTLAGVVEAGGFTTRVGVWLVLGQVSPSTRSYRRVLELYW